jgi:transposase
MAMVGGFDVHRNQITFDCLDTETGEVWRGEIRPATRVRLREWLGRFQGRQAAIALEATTGWRFVVEELQAAGIEAHLAEPADTRALRGPKRRAKNDRQDARHLRELLQAGQLPESWIPPTHIQELRSLVRLRKSLMDERRVWQQRIQAILYHQGQPARPRLLTVDKRQWLASLELSPAGRQRVDLALRMLDHLHEELEPIERQLLHYARHQPGCQALIKRHYGIGAVTAAAILCEQGDVRRFSSSRKAVRHSGLDVTVYESDNKRSPGKLSRQGPPALRWALYEAATSAARSTSPDHSYYLEVKARVGSSRARLSIARKLLRRAYHTLWELGDQAQAEVA